MVVSVGVCVCVCAIWMWFWLGGFPAKKLAACGQVFGLREGGVCFHLYVFIQKDFTQISTPYHIMKLHLVLSS